MRFKALRLDSGPWGRTQSFEMELMGVFDDSFMLRPIETSSGYLRPVEAS